MRNNSTTTINCEAHLVNDKPVVKTGSTPDSPGVVTLTDDGHVLVRGLSITSRDVFDYLNQKEESQRVRLLIEAIETGIYCLERASQVHGLDFVRQQVQIVTGEMAKLPMLIETEFRKQVGAKDGVLAPIVGAVSTTEKLLKEKLQAVQVLLDKDIDPRRPDTALGTALTTIGNLLDEKRDDSLPKKLTRAIDLVATEDGQLIKTLKTALATLVKPLQDELAHLRKEIHQRQGAEEALARTAAKGNAFEMKLLSLAQSWSRCTGATVEHVGVDHQPGDILVTVSDSLVPVDEFRIIIEARDDSTGRGQKRIADAMAQSMKQRGAHYGLYVVRTDAAVAQEITDWAEGRCSHGPFVACTARHLITALRFAIIDYRMKAIQTGKPEADIETARQELRRIRTAMRRIKTIKTKSSEFHKGADAITREADELLREINDALLIIEDALRSSAAEAA